MPEVGTVQASADRQALDIRHVLLDTDAAHPSQANGVHNVVRSLAAEQQAAGDAPRVVVLQAGPPRAVPAPVPVTTLKLAGFAPGGHVLRLDKAAWRQMVDGAGFQTVFHVHGGRQPVLIDLARRLYRAGLLFTLTTHGRCSHVLDQHGQVLRPRTALYLRLLERPALERAEFVQALSDAERAVLAWIAPRARIEIVGNGAYSRRIGLVPPAPPPRSPSPDFPVFIYCGRYAIAHKGLDLLLEGFAQFRRRRGTGMLRLIGSGAERQGLLRMAERLGIADCTHIDGPAFGAARDAALGASDFFVMSSRYEGAPVAALEAALLGLPLIMSPGTGLRDMIERSGAGIGIAGTTAEDVCDAFCQAAAVGRDGYRRQAAGAFQMALSAADWTAIAARLRQLYRGCV